MLDFSRKGENEIEKRTLILALIIAANSSYAKEYYFNCEKNETENSSVKKIMDELNGKEFLAKELKEKLRKRNKNRTLLWK